jgi:hypothetical protein
MNGAIPDIRFYDFNFNLLHMENQFISSNWSVFYNDIGNFEAHFDLGSDTLPVIMDNNYIAAVQGEMSAIIVGKKLGNDLTVYGRTCNWLLTKRVTGAFGEITETVCDLVNGKVEDAFSRYPSDFSVEVVTDVSDTPTVTTSRNEKCETFKLVQELLKQERLGHKMIYNSKENKWVFQVIKGNEYNLLVISAANRNVYDITMDWDLLDLYTEGVYKQGEGVITNPNIPPNGEALHWVKLLSASGPGEALAELNNAVCVNKIQCKTNSVYFGNDYELGDVVTVQYQVGQYKYSEKKRIAGINIWYESGNTGEEPVFEDLN